MVAPSVSIVSAVVTRLSATTASSIAFDAPNVARAPAANASSGVTSTTLVLLALVMLTSVLLCRPGLRRQVARLRVCVGLGVLIRGRGAALVRLDHAALVIAADGARHHRAVVGNV